MSHPVAPTTAAAAAAPASDPRRMRMPRAAADALPRAGLRLELHYISFSHYCARARWYLGACGVPVDALHPLLPVQHLPHMVALLKRMRAPRCPPTASSRSPASTPALAAFDRGTGAPIFLLQDSELIGRWAALRAQVFLNDGGAAARRLYGQGATLSVEEEEEEEEDERAKDDAGGGGAEGGGGEAGRPRRQAFSVAVLTYEAKAAGGGGPPGLTTPADLERRLSAVLGVEARRLVYFHLLPRVDHLARLFSRNPPTGPSSSSSPGGVVGALGALWAQYVTCPLWALAASLALPRLLNVNRDAVDTGALLLAAEFDFLDALVEARGCLIKGASGGEGAEEERVGAFLFGEGGPSAADISLAALGGIIAGDVGPGYGARLPLVAELPPGLRKAVRERFAGRPAARYALALWREHGAAAVAASSKA